ncbi:MAG: ATP-binding protein, partial [Deltaproteobacteria bacterium]|nr:ATP-binding protein [Deltaproteobacteria bacterium]
MSASKPKKFCVAGPCDPLDHYMLPALPRLPEVQDLVNSEEYFVLHAPRQSGKTTSIYAAVAQINAEKKYYALSCSLARLDKVTDNGQAMSSIIGLIYGALRNAKFLGLKKTFVDGALASISQDPDFKESPIQLWLNFLSERIKKDLVIFFDEAD